MRPVSTWEETTWTRHPPYQDPGLTGYLGDIFQSRDGRFKATYWEAQGPGKLLERPKSDELICILEGEIVVEVEGRRATAGPGDVVLWLTDDPPLLTIPERVKAFCVTYQAEGVR